MKRRGIFPLLYLMISDYFLRYQLDTAAARAGGCEGVYTPPINENFSLLPAKRGNFFFKFYPISLKNSYTPPLHPPNLGALARPLIRYVFVSLGFCRSCISLTAIISLCSRNKLTNINNLIMQAYSLKKEKLSLFFYKTI
jgi:hypothetical protein